MSTGKSKVLFLSFQENADVIGAKYLDALIASKGYRSSILLVPLDTEANRQAAIEHVMRLAPDVLCFSVMSYEFARASRFALMLRKKLAGRPIVFGGIHPTVDPESCLAVSDVVARGEGEETLLELLRVFETGNLSTLSEVHGIVFRRNGEIVHTPVRQPVKNLDALPAIRHLPESLFVVHDGTIRPIRDREMRRRYARYQGTFLSALSSRGCPYSCHYCSNSALKALYGHNSVRVRQPDAVVDEIAREVAECPEVLYVNFQDDCFMLHNQQWMEQFARRYRTEVRRPFIVRTTPRHITREKLILLKEAGLRWVFMGMQTGSDRINLEFYGRPVTAQQFFEAATLVSECGLSPWYDVILDNPYETEADQLLTIDLLLRIPRPYQLAIYSLDLLPGTRLLERAQTDGIGVPTPVARPFTQPQSTFMNRSIRMCATLPRALVRSLVGLRASKAGRCCGGIAYAFCLLLEPFIYMWLVFKSWDCRVAPTVRTTMAFYRTAFNKLFLRKHG